MLRDASEVTEKNKGTYLIGASIRVSESNNALGLYEVYCVKEGAIDTSSIRSLDTKVSSPEVSSAPLMLSLLKKVSEVNIDDKIENRHQCRKDI